MTVRPANARLQAEPFCLQIVISNMLASFGAAAVDSELASLPKEPSPARDGVTDPSVTCAQL